MNGFLNMLRKIENVVLISGFMFIVAIIFIQVILRYIFHNTMPWVEELCRYMFIYLTWLGAARAVVDDKHIRVSVLRNKLGDKAKYVDIVVTLLCIFTCVFLLKCGIEMIQKMQSFSQRSATLGVPMWYFYIAVPIGAACMGLRYLQKLIQVDIPAMLGRREVRQE